MDLFEHLCESGHAEWVDRSRERVRVYYHSVVEWANLIFSYVVKNGLSGSVCTLYELRESDDVEDEGSPNFPPRYSPDLPKSSMNWTQKSS